MVLFSHFLTTLKGSARQGGAGENPGPGGPERAGFEELPESRDEAMTQCLPSTGLSQITNEVAR